jgi:hypothetical protein
VDRPQNNCPADFSAGGGTKGGGDTGTAFFVRRMRSGDTEGLTRGDFAGGIALFNFFPQSMGGFGIKKAVDNRFPYCPG